MAYEVYVIYSDDESSAYGYEFGTDEDFYTLKGLESLHEAINQAEAEMANAKDGIEIRRTYIVNEQNDLIVWNSNNPPELKAYNSYSYEEWNTLEQGHHEKSDMPSIYFDIDGTLGKWYADGRGFSYEEIIDPRNHYFRDIEPHSMMILLAERLKKEGFDVCIISAADKNTIRDKWEWIDEHLPFILKENICFCPIGADKSQFVKGNAEISVLIDDYNKNLEEWEGTSIKAINTVNSHQDKFAEIDFTGSEALLDETPAFFVTDVEPWIRNTIEKSLTAAADKVTDTVRLMPTKARLKEKARSEHSDNIYINESTESVTWVYYNPDSSAGGQLVYNEVSFDEIREALEAPNPLDYIQSVCRQSCIDVGHPCFVGYARDFLFPYNKETLYAQCNGENVLANMEAAVCGNKMESILERDEEIKYDVGYALEKYEEYKHRWTNEHISAEVMSSTESAYENDEAAEGMTFSEYVEEFGFTDGSCYSCFGEFVDNEFPLYALADDIEAAMYECGEYNCSDNERAVWTVVDTPADAILTSLENEPETLVEYFKNKLDGVIETDEWASNARACIEKIQTLCDVETPKSVSKEREELEH